MLPVFTYLGETNVYDDVTYDTDVTNIFEGIVEDDEEIVITEQSYVTPSKLKHPPQVYPGKETFVSVFNRLTMTNTNEREVERFLRAPIRPRNLHPFSKPEDDNANYMPEALRDDKFQ
jgi:hypothetical protein